MVVSDTLAYAELFSILEHAAAALGRAVNPTLYSFAEFESRRMRKNVFLSRVLDQQRLWVVGSDGDLAAR
jgi:hypothetical protein